MSKEAEEWLERMSPKHFKRLRKSKLELLVAAMDAYHKHAMEKEFKSIIEKFHYTTDELKEKAEKFANSQSETIPPRRKDLALGYFWGMDKMESLLKDELLKKIQ